ncbi:MAG: hypothetical protein LUC97_01785, partial [Clostridiales bacterium]|nr:hypothetical protein [Clostridiales bacterium]
MNENVFKEMRGGRAYCGCGGWSIFDWGGYLTVSADTGEAGDFSVTGDSGGYTYADNILTIESAGEYTITMASGVSSTSDDRIVVDADGEVSLTISGISITSSEDSPLRADGGDLTLILEGDNYLTASGSSYEGLSKTSGDNSLKITSIDGDGEAAGSLTAAGGSYSAGIGGGMSASGNNIEIAGGTVNAAGGSYGGAGIGGGYWGNAYSILISGGVVNAEGSAGAGIGSGFQAGYSSVAITGGYVNASSGYGAAIGGGDRDYGTAAVSISGGYIKATTNGGDGIGGGYINSTSTKEIAITGGCFAEGDISADTVYDTEVYTGYQVVSNTDSGTSSDYPYMVEINDSDMADCAFIITGSDISLYEDYTYKDNVLIIKKGGTYRISMNTELGTSTETDRIVVYADSAVKLTICDIDITSSTGAAFRADAGDLTLVLEGDNYLTSGDLNYVGYAGLTKESSSNSLKITSCEGDGETADSLTAVGGYLGAGIGGGSGGSGSDITITGGTVTATSSIGGAGIGGGRNGNGSDITITGGTVEASSSGDGAGIGGGYYANGSNITIS